MKTILIVWLIFDFTYAFSQDTVDTLELWNYNLELYLTHETEKPIGKISFWRTRPINDRNSLRIYGKPWTPNISYEIFNLSDSTYCFKQSFYTKAISSCAGANLGGDIIIIGEYLLLNRNICLNCMRYDTQIDYCRPAIKKIVSKVDEKNARTLGAVVGQFGIKESELPTPKSQYPSFRVKTRK